MTDKFYHTKESVDQYISMAQDVNGLELIEQFKPYLSQDSDLLEIGSGPGSDWEILNKSFNVIGSDNSKEFLSRLRNKFPNGQFIELDAISIETDLKFDCIYTNKVLHHLTDTELSLSIERQQEILKPKGIICHSFWKGNGSEEFKGMFVNNHNEQGILEFFQNKFDILVIKEYQEFEANDSLLLIGQKK